MDPLSITSAIGTATKLATSAWDIGEALYSFVQNTRKINKNVNDLADTTKAFGDTCQLVRASLETLKSAYSDNQPSLEHLRSEDDRLLWTGIQLRLQRSESIIKELQLATAGVQQPRPNFATQAVRQIKLSLSMDEINSIQDRLSVQMSTLSLSLQAIKMYAFSVFAKRFFHDPC